MHDQFTEQLSLYHDGDLPPDERAAVAAHLEGCTACRAVLDDLSTIVQRARSLEPVAPPRDLWAGIAAEIAAGERAGARARYEEADADDAVSKPPARLPGRDAVLRLRPRRLPRSFTLTVPQLAAAAIALILTSALAVRLLAPGEPAVTPSLAGDATGAVGSSGVQLVSSIDMSYESTIAYLEQTLESARDVLDPATTAVLEQSLAAIDDAIAEARAAIAADPANAFLGRHLDNTMRRKVDLLREASRIATRT
jgi:hypothetical protein